jgi:hypothetical protein
MTIEIPKIREKCQKFLFQAHPNNTKIGILAMQIYHLATLFVLIISIMSY